MGTTMIPRSLLRRLASALGIVPRLGPAVSWGQVEALARRWLLMRGSGCRAIIPGSVPPPRRASWSEPTWLLLQASIASLLAESPSVVRVAELELEADELARQAGMAEARGLRAGRRGCGAHLWREADRLREEAARIRRGACYAREIAIAAERISMAARDDRFLASVLGVIREEVDDGTS